MVLTTMSISGSRYDTTLQNQKNGINSGLVLLIEHKSKVMNECKEQRETNECGTESNEGRNVRNKED